MSGGGGGGYPIRPDDAPIDCESIVDETILNSPDPTVLNKLTVGDLLMVDIIETEGRRSLVARTDAGEIAGAITSDSLRDLIRCINEGNSYQAKVIELDGGLCRVEVRHTVSSS